MNNIPCEIIQDLLPSYVDGLTNDVTNAAIEEHVESCEKCRQILEGMRDGIEKQYVPDDSDKKEIDFLKKNKKRNVKVVIFSLAAAIFALAAIVFIRFFVVGEARYDNWLECKVTVDGKSLSVEGYPVDPAHAVSDTIITEEDGVVTISTKAVRKNFIHKGGFYIDSYEAQNDIHKVVLDGRVVWEDGEDISLLASEVYETRHDYVGEMPANGETARALNMQGRLGDYRNELMTAEEPYGWILRLPDYTEKDRALKESDMESIAYILIAMTGNLDWVRYEYSIEGHDEVMTIDAAMASEFFGQNIKDCGKSMRLLDRLIDKTGLE